MRGKDDKNGKKHYMGGITPAHAGKSCCGKHKAMHVWDHPRACGEKPGRSGHAHNRRGSPPRMRGKALKILSSYDKRGITPAHAGKSISIYFTGGGEWDHPRACGEKAIPTDGGRALTGSPPRMRGKDCFVKGETQSYGITPAHAGKSCP